MRSKIVIGLVGVSCALCMWLVVKLYHELLSAYEHSSSLTDLEYSWIFRLLLNMAGYATVLLPMFIIYKYLEMTNYFEKVVNPSCMSRALFSCFGEPGERLAEGGRAREAAGGLELAACFVGLMAAYLLWGLLQEKMMTQSYSLADGSVVRFSDSQFLVFTNRLLALLLAGGRLWARGAPCPPAPLYKFSYCALTNVLSAWCQYEALKYVSFPTQVLSKSCKVVPVMLMGKLVSRAKYEPYEYATAVLISVGMALFMLGSRDDYTSGAASSASGALLLCAYMASDSFTASWQAALFARYRVAPLHMLCAVNGFSCLLTAAALLHRSDTLHSLALLKHPAFAADCLVLSASSALGQLLIYRTISKFGAVVFTIIMTLRQAASILLSCLVYGHGVSGAGAAGVALVLASVALRLYARQRARAGARPAPL